MGESKALKEEITQLIRDAKEVFRKVSIVCKGWFESGEKPQVTKSFRFSKFTYLR